MGTPYGRPTYDLLVICLGALTLSNRRLRELRPLNYNPDQKVLGHLPFSLGFVWKLQLTCDTHSLTWP